MRLSLRVSRGPTVPQISTNSQSYRFATESHETSWNHYHLSSQNPAWKSLRGWLGRSNIIQMVQTTPNLAHKWRFPKMGNPTSPWVSILKSVSKWMICWECFGFLNQQIMGCPNMEYPLSWFWGKWWYTMGFEDYHVDYTWSRCIPMIPPQWFNPSYNII